MSLIDKRPTSAPKGARADRMAESTKNYVKCPHCGGVLKYVKDSRPSVIGAEKEMIIRRQRQCDDCGSRAATIEVLETYMLSIRQEALKEIALAIMAGQIK